MDLLCHEDIDIDRLIGESKSKKRILDAIYNDKETLLCCRRLSIDNDLLECGLSDMFGYDKPAKKQKLSGKNSLDKSFGED